MQLNVDENTLKGMVREAILATFTPEVRNDLVSKAVRDLLDEKPDGSNGRRDKSRLQLIFDSEVESFAYKAIREMFESDQTVKASVESLVKKAWQKVLSDEEGIADSMAKALTRVLCGRAY